MLNRLILTVFFVLISVFGMRAQNGNPLPADMEAYKSQCERLLRYLEDTFNFLGDSTQPVSEKEIIINESFTKVFRDDRVQIEDDLDPHRITPVYKDVQAYMKDIMFFFKNVRFSYEVVNIEPLVNDSGYVYFKVSFNRKLEGVTVTGDTVSDIRIRFMEINLNPAGQSLKIASIYTTPINEKANISRWWNNMSSAWRTYFGKSVLVYDTLPLSMILSFTDSTLVTTVWKPIRPDSLQIASDSAVADTISAETAKQVPDTVKTNTEILFKVVSRIKRQHAVDISGNLTLKTLNPLSQMSDLRDLDISHTLIDDLKPIRNLGKLESLRMSGTPVSDLTPLRFLWHLQLLDFSFCPLSDIGVLRGLTALEIVKGNHTAVKSVAPVSGHLRLRHLQLAGCHINDIDSLTGLPALSKLDLQDNPIRSVDSLEQFAALQQLNLDTTFVKDLSPLSNLQLLSVLQINHTPVSDLKPLLKIQSLKIIYCDNSGVNEEEAMWFMKQKPSCLVIFNSGKLVRWWQSLPPVWKKTLLPEYKKGVNPSKEKLHRLVHLVSLDLSGKKDVSDLSYLAMLHQLEELHIDFTRVTSLSPVSELSQLSVLTARGTPVDDLTPLKNLTALKRIDLTETDISDLTPLLKNKEIEKIYCGGTEVNEQNVDTFLLKRPEALVVFETEKLVFWWNNLEDDWQTLFRAMEHFNETPSAEDLHRLAERTSLHFTGLPAGINLNALEPFFRLRKLVFDNCSITDISALSGLSRLEELSITNGPLSDLSGIEKLSNLKRLTLSNTAVEDIYLLADLNNLIFLDISGTRVSSLKPLRNLETLKTLIINNTRVKTLKYIAGLQRLKLLKCYNTPMRAKRVDDFKAAHPGTEVIYY